MKTIKIKKWRKITDSETSLFMFLIGLVYSIVFSFMIDNPLPFFAFCVLPYLVTKIKFPYKEEYELGKKI